MKLFAMSMSLATAKSGNMNGEYLVTTTDTMGVPFNSDYASKVKEIENMFEMCAFSLTETFAFSGT